MIQYNNIKNFLTSIDYSFLSDKDEFINSTDKSKKVLFKCPNNHSSSLMTTSFTNAKKLGKNLCVKCRKNTELDKQFEELKNDVFNSTGHILLNMEDTHHIVYECGTCHSINTTNKVALMRRLTPYCHHCQNDLNKLDLDDVKARVEKMGMEFISYNGNNKNLTVKCFCGEISNKKSLADIERGKGCKECRIDNIQTTNLLKYGVKNTFQYPEFKEKSKRTCEEKYGAPHAMQVPSLFHQAMSSAFSTKEYIFPSGRKENIMGYEPFIITNILSKGTLEDSIIVGDSVKSFVYYDDSGKKHVYHPDMEIKNGNKTVYVEVKSIYIFNKEPDIVWRKLTAISREGYESIMYITSKNKLLDEWEVDIFGNITCKSGNYNEFDKKLKVENGQVYLA